MTKIRFISSLIIMIGLALIVSQAGPSYAQSSTSLYEPSDGQVYFGFTYRIADNTDPLFGDTRPFAERYQDAINAELGGKMPSVFVVPSNWQNVDGSMNTFSTYLVNINKVKAVAPDSVPILTWKASTGSSQQTPYSGIATKTIISGTQDSYIHQFAQDVKAYGQPIFIRGICQEMNGNWYKSCSPLANPDLTKADYINAYRHVVDIFRAEGATNVSWVWNVNTFPGSAADATAMNIDTDIAGYYPGDNYVDWVGVDHYDFGDPAKPNSNPLTPAVWMNPAYNFAIGHNKPVMVAEWGVRHASVITSTEHQQWLGLMFDYFESHPKIKAIVYFNFNGAVPYTNTTGHTFLYNNQVNYAPNANDSDSRLLAESGANFRGTFSTRISNARYVSKVTTSPPPQNPTPTPTPTPPPYSNPQNCPSSTRSISLPTFPAQTRCVSETTPSSPGTPSTPGNAAGGTGTVGLYNSESLQQGTCPSGMVSISLLTYPAQTRCLANPSPTPLISLRFGKENADVLNLQKFLASDKTIYPQGITTGYFGSLTRQAVIRFQGKYANEILIPLGLTRGTGFVGPSTLKKINELVNITP